MTTPQQVTERYVSNLIHNGRNREFDILRIDREEVKQQDQIVAIWFSAVITHQGPLPSPQILGVGATISAAIRHALTEHGVTFR